MSAEIWKSELVVYSFMFLNMLTVGAGLLWAWRRKTMFSNHDTEIPGLGPELPTSETRNV